MSKGIILSSEGSQHSNGKHVSAAIFKDDAHKNWDASQTSEVRHLMGSQKTWTQFHHL